MQYHRRTGLSSPAFAEHAWMEPAAYRRRAHGVVSPALGTLSWTGCGPVSQRAVLDPRCCCFLQTCVPVCTLARHKDKPVYSTKKHGQTLPRVAVSAPRVSLPAPGISILPVLQTPQHALPGGAAEGGAGCGRLPPGPARVLVLEALSVPFPGSEDGTACSPSRATTRGSQPCSCCFALFPPCRNQRGQVRCASKHRNHILNGNEMCELNVNYSRMEGQSLLVKV